MRVRPLRQASRRTTAAPRRPHLVQVPARTEPAPEPAPQPELTAERRVRESGGPEDRAFYTCACGFAFQADVSTSVACPHCGAGQAW
jgi:hypothetical protein